MSKPFIIGTRLTIGLYRTNKSSVLTVWTLLLYKNFARLCSDLFLFLTFWKPDLGHGLAHKKGSDEREALSWLSFTELSSNNTVSFFQAWLNQLKLKLAKVSDNCDRNPQLSETVDAEVVSAEVVESIPVSGVRQKLDAIKLIWGFIKPQIEVLKLQAIF